MIAISTGAPRLCFIHVPKCAGGALHLALRGHYGLVERHHLSAVWSRRLASWRDIPLRSHRLGLLQKRLASPRLRYVSGHYPIELDILESHGTEWHFLTLLRPPVERWLSNYFFNRYKSTRHFRTRANLLDYMASSPGRASARTYLRHFGGWQPRASTERCIERACQTLERFHSVGITERLDLLAHRLGGVLGGNIQMEKHNLNPLPVRRQDELVTPALREAIAKECAADTLIYEHAKKLALGDAWGAVMPS